MEVKNEIFQHTTTATFTGTITEGDLTKCLKKTLGARWMKIIIIIME